MARLLATTNDKFYSEAKALNKAAGLDMSVEKDKNGISVATYKKRVINSFGNWYQSETGVFVACSGTLVFNGKVGKAALRGIASAYSGDLTEIQDSVFGHYALLISDQNEVKICCDSEHSYAIYYWIGDNDLFVSTTLYTVAKVVGASVDRIRLYERILEYSNIGPKTPFTEVRRLYGNEHIVIDDSGISVETGVDARPLPNYQKMTLPDVVKDYSSRIRTILREINNAFPESSISLQMTGGMDTRLILSGLLKTGRYPHLIYGVGNSKLTNTFDGDRNIVTQLADRFDLEYYEMDWKGDPTETDHWAELFKKYGFGYTVSGCTKSRFEEFEGEITPYPVLNMSGFCASVTNRMPWTDELDRNRISLQKWVSNHYMSLDEFQDNAVRLRDEYISHLADSIEIATKRCYDIDVTNQSISPKDHTKLDFHIGRKRLATRTNLQNEYGYYLALLAVHELNRPLFHIPSEYRRGNEFQIAVIRNLEPELLNVPLFSGTKHVSVQGGKAKRIPEGGILKRTVLKLPEPLLSLIRIAYHRVGFLQENEPKKNHDFYINRLQDRPCSEHFDFNNFDGDLRTLNFFELFEEGIEQLGETKIR